jgi:lysozyme
VNLGAKGEALIKSFEKLRLAAYKPTPRDKWTIGWGHTAGVVEGMTCTEAQAEAFFQADMSEAIECLNAARRVALTQNQFDALVSFVFNVGSHNFLDSTLLKLLNERRYEIAASQFMRWDHQDNVILTGLKDRREAEQRLFCEQD